MSETILKVTIKANVLNQLNIDPIVTRLGISLNADIPTIIDNKTTPSQKGRALAQVLTNSLDDKIVLKMYLRFSSRAKVFLYIFIFIKYLFFNYLIV
jgi:hypothetical protein